MSQLRLFPADSFNESIGGIEKRDAARIVHEYLVNTLKEPDESSIQAACVLLDLYDCHSCVNHVAQVYLKGIIKPSSKREFGMRRVLSLKDILEVERKVFDKTLREIPDSVKDTCNVVKPLSFDRIKEIKGGVVIDVRSETAFAIEHLKDAVNLPLTKYVLNPYLASKDRYAPLIFICEHGANAQIAAELAVKSGYMNVYSTAYKNE